MMKIKIFSNRINLMVELSKIFVILIIILFSFKETISQQVIVSLKTPPPNQLNTSDLWNLTLNNISQNALRVYLEGYIDEDTDGRILEGKSEVFDLPAGMKIITANSINASNITFKNNKYKEIIIRTGNAPSGNYHFCVFVKLENGVEAGSDCKIQNIMITSPPMLINPANESVIAEINPAFSWTPPSPFKSGQSITYNFKIVEIINNEPVGQAITRPGFEQQNIQVNLFQYPISAPKLEAGKQYVWQVEAYNNGIPLGKSEVWKFSLKNENKIPPSNKELIMAASNIIVELDRLIYPEGSSITAKVIVDSGTVALKNLALVFSSHQSKDVEVIKLVKTENDSIYVTEKSLPVKRFTSESDTKPFDGFLTIKPNELFFAIYYPKDSADIGKGGEVDMVSDFGLFEDREFIDSPFRVIKELAMTDDETQVPPGGKKIGTVTVKNGLPIQFPVDELVIYPRNDKQLRRFLEQTNGQIVMSDIVPGENRKAQSYLVKVNTSKVRLQDFSQTRALLQLTDEVYASNEDVVKIMTLAMEYFLKGYLVTVNPRLQFAGSTSENKLSNIPDFKDKAVGKNMTDKMFEIPKVWSYMALWDADVKNIPVGFIDMGFSFNYDFRGNRDMIIEYNLDNGTKGPRTAEAPPTVGNSFFGSKTWHGTGVVTTAGGVINNDWGGSGTGGQVVNPMLCSVGLKSYASEMGMAMKILTNEGANIINISAGYPCKVLLQVIGPLGVCHAWERAATCSIIATALSATAFTAAAVICATVGPIPIVGPVACAIAMKKAYDVLSASSKLCYEIVALGEVKSEMQKGVDYALERGVTVVSIAGNKFEKDKLPVIIKDIINSDESDMSVNKWEIIPGSLPGVICVGSCDSSAPYLNRDFFGDRVDIWAPVFTPYWAPKNTDAVDDPDKHVIQGALSGTSTAVPYIVGLIADMQAINDSLNPKLVTDPVKRKNIPGRILDLLVSNAYKGSELTKLGGTDRRRVLVNPLKTIIASSPKEIQDLNNFMIKGYNNSLGFDEIDPSKKFDNETSAQTINFTSAFEYRGVVGMPNGLKLKDVDYFKVIYPTAPGIYGEGSLRITIPNGSVWKFGEVLINGIYYPPIPSSIKPDESTIEVKLPEMLYGCISLIKLEGYLSNDNVYNLTFIPGKKTGEPPAPDKLDVNPNPIGKPDNNDKSRAFPIGTVILTTIGTTDEYNWKPVKKDYYEVNVPDLNFHTCSDEDWFELSPPSSLIKECEICTPTIEVKTLSGGKFADVHISVYDNTWKEIYNEESSFISLSCEDQKNFPLYFKLWSKGKPIKYDLKLSYDVDPKKIEVCKKIMAWMGELTHPAITIKKPIVCDIGKGDYGPVFYQIDWTGGGDFTFYGKINNEKSLLMQLINSDGIVMSEAVTPDIAAQFSNAKVADIVSEMAILNFLQPNLQEGTYFISLSQFKTESSVHFLLPRSVTISGYPSAEDFSPFNQNQNVSFILKSMSSPVYK